MVCAILKYNCKFAQTIPFCQKIRAFSAAKQVRMPRGGCAPAHFSHFSAHALRATVFCKQKFPLEKFFLPCKKN